MPGLDCTEDARRCPHGIAHAGRLVSTGQYADVHCCARTIPRESLPIRQDNLRSHRPAGNVGGILNWHSHGHSYLCTYHMTMSDAQLHEAIFNTTLSNRNQWSAARKQVRGLNAQTFLTTWNIYSFYIDVSKKLNIGQLQEGRISMYNISVSRDMW